MRRIRIRGEIVRWIVGDERALKEPIYQIVSVSSTVEGPQPVT